MYVALSRVTSVDNLFLIGKYRANVFRVENSILGYKRLQENRCDTIYTDNVNSNSLSVSLLNTRSLKRHTVDINRARQLTENDILCFTKSLIAYDTDVTEVL